MERIMTDKKPSERPDVDKTLKQTDKPWTQPEKEQGTGAEKSDVEKWSETNTH